MNTLIQNSILRSYPILILFIILTFFTEHLKSESNISAAAGDLKNFSVHERNEEGFLVWQLTGDNAKKRTDGKVEIEQILIKTFQKSQEEWTLSTPSCLMNEISREAVSESDVRISNHGTEITGIGFYWLPNESRFIIRNKARVVLTGSILKKSS